MMGMPHPEEAYQVPVGVYDNLGVTCLEPGSESDVGYNRFTPRKL